MSPIHEVMRRHIPSLSVLLLAASLHAAAQQLPVKTYTTTDGLPHYNISRIVRDSRGFLWFCTGEGLSRYDGYTFTNFGAQHGLPGDAVTDLLETRRGAYWVATTRGVARFDPRGRPGTSAPMFTAVARDPDAPGTEATTTLTETRDGTIWIGTENGLHRLEQTNGRATIRPVEIGLPEGTVEERTVTDILEDRRGLIWVASPSGLYRHVPHGATRRYTVRDGLPNDFLQTLLEDREGRLWAGTRLGGLVRFSVDASQTLVIDLARTAPELPTSWVFQLYEASDGRIWAATARGLVEVLRAPDEKLARVRAYSIANGLNYFDITAVAEDLGGNLWLGTNSAGAMKIARSGFTSYADWEGIQQIADIFEDRAGQLCFRGTVFGDSRTTLHSRFGCLVSGRFQWFQWLTPHHVGWVNKGLTLQTQSGEWWVGSGRGVYRYPAADSLASIAAARPLAVYSVPDGLASPQVYRLFEDSRGQVWVSTISAATHGLARWDPATGRMRDMGGTPGLPSLETELPRSFAEDAAGHLWIGFDTGLARYAEDRFTWFGAREGLPPGAVVDIFRDHLGRLWLAFARSGLARVDDPVAARPTFVPYTTAQGLSSNNLEVIAEDRGGFIYVGGGHGLDRIDPSTGRVTHFTAVDGLPTGRFHDSFLDRHGVLWFGLSSGLVRYSPPKEVTAGPPAVLITELRIAGVPQPVSVIGERALAPADLAPDQNDVQIDFVGLGAGTGDVLRYQYMLAGAAADWSLPGDQRTVTYASLSPGRYTFLVRAVNSAGAMSAAPASVTFRILRPVWQQWWFLTAATLVLGVATYSFYRYRLTRLLEMANLRTRIASDLHDDIGANLTRIALLSETARQTHEEGALGSIARIARESVSAMSDIVWAINPRRESLTDLTRRMRQHAEELFTGRDTELVFRAPDGDGLNLGVDVRRDVLLVFKEAVNNASRHAQCTRVVIDLRREAGRLVLSVQDNGVGFDTAAESDGQGIGSLRRRATRLKGTIEIVAGRGRGTTVTLGVPL